MRLRPYQSECLRAIDEGFARHRALMTVMATGLGKTVVFSHLARRCFKRVLILAHRDELIRQAADKVRAICGEEPGVEMGESRSPEGYADPPRVVVSSVQTMFRPNRQRRFRPADFGLLVVDECHHAVARSYREPIAYFAQNPDLNLLGVTATPTRADKLAMGQVFDAVAYEYGIEPAVEDGWLVPPHQKAVVVEGLDFSGVRSLAGDLSPAELEEVLSREKVLHATAAPAVELAGDLPALVFCATVAHARLMAEVLCRYKPQSALALDGTTNRDVRRETVERFRRGEVQFLCNCGLFLEGFDAPNTAVVVMARPTKSLALYAQILGRGTRPLPGVVDFDAPDGPEGARLRREAIAASPKPSMLVLDFVGNSGRHRLVTAADLLGGKFGEPARDYARKLAEADGPTRPVDERLEQARDELALLAEIRERRRLADVRAARADYTAREVSPFGRSPGGAAFVQSGQVPREPATEKQAWFLHKRGWALERARALSKRQASAIISKLKEAAGG